MANVTIQLDRSVIGYGNAGDVITVTQTAITDNMTTNGLAHTYVGPIAPALVGNDAYRYIVVAAIATALPNTPGIDVVFIATNVAAVPTLPTAVGNINTYTFKNASGSAITPLVTSAQTIDGSAAASLANNGTLRVVSDGTNWRTI